jgi:hypothetical protein
VKKSGAVRWLANVQSNAVASMNIASSRTVLITRDPA